MSSEGVEIPISPPEEVVSSPEAEKKPEGMELLLSQVDRLAQLIQQEIEVEKPNSPEEEEEFQEYMHAWVAEYQRLVQSGQDYQKEALEVLGMIRALLGDLPVEDGLLPKNVYDLLPPESLDET